MDAIESDLPRSRRKPRIDAAQIVRTTASSRILTRRVSKKTTGYIASNGRPCQAVTSAITASVTEPGQ